MGFISSITSAKNIVNSNQKLNQQTKSPQELAMGSLALSMAKGQTSQGNGGSYGAMINAVNQLKNKQQTPPAGVDTIAYSLSNGALTGQGHQLNQPQQYYHPMWSYGNNNFNPYFRNQGNFNYANQISQPVVQSAPFMNFK